VTGRPSVFLAALAVAWTGVLAAYAFVWVVDPYELRWQRPTERLAMHTYPGDVTPRLGPAAAAEGTDVAIVGGSTAMGYTPQMIRRVFAADRPVNLAYFCATDEDLAQILPRIEASTRLKRLIISLDFTLMWHCQSSTSPFDSRYYAPAWYDPVPEFNRTSIKLSAVVLRTGLLDMPGWRPAILDQVPGVNDMPSLNGDSHEVAFLARRATSERMTVTSGPAVPCAAIPALRTVILPAARRLSARRVTLDLLAPPYSLAYYFSGDTPQANEEAFSRLMALRRCTLEATAGLRGVRFHSFDTDLSIVGDLSNYKDVGHIRKYELYERLARSVAAGANVVSPERWEQEQATLKAELAAFTPLPAGKHFVAH
jgi:hypothetical protein